MPFSPNFDDDIFVNKGNMLSKWRKARTPGIVQECCIKPCSIKTFKSFCDTEQFDFFLIVGKSLGLKLFFKT